jgi:hypothetical protein
MKPVASLSGAQRLYFCMHAAGGRILSPGSRLTYQDRNLLVEVGLITLVAGILPI